VGDFGIRVVIRDSLSFDDLGTCTAPFPVAPGDLVAREHGPPLRVVSMLPQPSGAAVVAVLARPAALSLVAR
jgi:hypothetical protein